MAGYDPQSRWQDNDDDDNEDDEEWYVLQSHVLSREMLSAWQGIEPCI